MDEKTAAAVEGLRMLASPWYGHMVGGTGAFSARHGCGGLVESRGDIFLCSPYDAAGLYRDFVREAGIVVTAESSFRGKSWEGMTMRQIGDSVGRFLHSMAEHAFARTHVAVDAGAMAKYVHRYNRFLYVTKVLNDGAPWLMSQKPSFEANGSRVVFPSLPNGELWMQETRSYAPTPQDAPTPFERSFRRMVQLNAREGEKAFASLSSRWTEKAWLTSAGASEAQDWLRADRPPPTREQSQAMERCRRNQISVKGGTVVESLKQRPTPMVIDLTADDSDDQADLDGDRWPVKRLVSREYSHDAEGSEYPRGWYILVAFEKEDGTDELLYKMEEEVKQELPEMYAAFMSREP